MSGGDGTIRLRNRKHAAGLARRRALQPRTEPGPNASRPTLVGVVERLLAGAAVGGAVIYALINALYIEYYDDFGVRPEDIGWDRLAILGRSAWIALILIPLSAGGCISVYADCREA
jgi:hypothetical protein